MISELDLLHDTFPLDYRQEAIIIITDSGRYVDEHVCGPRPYTLK